MKQRLILNSDQIGARSPTKCSADDEQLRVELYVVGLRGHKFLRFTSECVEVCGKPWHVPISKGHVCSPSGCPRTSRSSKLGLFLDDDNLESPNVHIHFNSSKMVTSLDLPPVAFDNDYTAFEFGF